MPAAGRAGRAPAARRVHHYDFTRPYELAYDSGVQLAVFSFPREMLGLPADLVGRLTAVRVSADGGTGALAAPLLRRVALDLDSVPELAEFFVTA